MKKFNKQDNNILNINGSHDLKTITNTVINENKDT